VCGVVTGPSPLDRWLTAPAVVRVGTLSYTAYLLHYPVFQAIGEELDAPVAVRVAVAWTLAGLLVVACHRLVEAPFLRLKERRAEARATSSGLASNAN
jgi:peptidoglycan/LPS O-acetylase OafA/YrhL